MDGLKDRRTGKEREGKREKDRERDIIMPTEGILLREKVREIKGEGHTYARESNKRIEERDCGRHGRGNKGTDR